MVPSLTGQGTPQPAAIKIKEIRATTQDIVANIIKDKVIVQGNIHKQIFFVGADGIVRHIPELVPFTALVEVPGALPGMIAQVHPVITNLISSLTPAGDAVIQKVIIDVFVTVTNFAQLTVLEDPAGEDVLAERVVGHGSTQILKKDSLTLVSPAVKVSEVRGNLVITGVDVRVDSVLVSGILHKQIFFVAQDGAAQHQAEDVEFQVDIPVVGALPGMNAQVHSEIKDIFFVLNQTGTVLNQEVVIDIAVKVTETVQVLLALGAGPLVKIEKVIGRGSSEVLDERTVQLTLPAIKVKDIEPVIEGVTARIIENKVVVQGTIRKEIVFVGQDNLEHRQTETISFSDFLEIPGAKPGANVFALPEIEFVTENPEIVNQGFLEKVLLGLDVVVTETVQIPVAVDPYGILFKLQEVIGEGMAQILVERVVPIPPVVPVSIIKERIRITRVIEKKVQALVENRISLEIQAIKIKAVDVVIESLTIETFVDKVLLQGVIRKQVFFVGVDNIVRHVEERKPFTIMIELPGVVPGQDVQASVRVENVIAKLVDGGFVAELLIILEATVGIVETQIIEVVVDVTGPGITTTKVLILVDVVDDSNPNPVPLAVVTDVTGPQIKEVIREVINVVVIDRGPNPVPLSVVVDVIFSG